MRPPLSSSYPIHRPACSQPTLKLWPTMPRLKTSKKNAWQPLAGSISSPRLIDFPIPQPEAPPEVPRQRRRLQRRRRPEALKPPTTPSQHVELQLLRPRSELPPLPSPEENLATNMKRYYTPTMSLSEYLSRAEPQPGLLHPCSFHGKGASRLKRRSSRYSMMSECSSRCPSMLMKSNSIYRKAVVALPQSPQYFLDSLEDNTLKPPVPLKIRPYSKASTTAYRRSILSGHMDTEGAREWDMGWEDFDTILDRWQSGVEDDEKTGLCPKGSSTVLASASATMSPMERWRSRWSSSSSGSSKMGSAELSLPALAHLPELESDTMSDPSSPHSHGPRTPFLQSRSPPPPVLTSRISHISQCMTEAEPKTPTTLSRHHGPSPSADAPRQSKANDQDWVSSGGYTPRQGFGVYPTSQRVMSCWSLQSQECPPSPMRPDYRYGGFHQQGQGAGAAPDQDLDLNKHWPRGVSGVPF